MVQALDLSVHKVFTSEEMKKLVSMYKLTHLIIGQEEYDENRDYIEALGSAVNVAVSADEGFVPAENSRIILIKKPFYCLSVVNILNSREDYEELSEDKNVICPGVRVLVVDDEPMNLMVAQGIFREYQMEVSTASGGMEAIRLCERKEFDLILLDHMMPGMDGVETLKRLRRIMKDAGKMTVPIIAFSANVVSGAREMFLSEGFDEFISKPVEEQELKRLLRKVLPKSSVIYKEREQSDTDKQPSAEEHGDNLALLAEKGFNTGEGMRYTGNDRDFYENMLLIFANSAQSKARDIEAAYRGSDVTNYRTLVHALKSSARMIGAEELSEQAREAEEAAKNGDIAYINGHTLSLLDKYREVSRQISLVLQAEPTAQEEPAGSETAEPDLLAGLTELKQSLDIFRSDKAEALIADMSALTYQGKPVSRLLHAAALDIGDFEFEAAAEKVQSVIDAIERGEMQ